MMRALAAAALAALAPSTVLAQAPAQIGPDVWNVMPPEQPVHALPGDPAPWTDGCTPAALGEAPVLPSPLTLEAAVRVALCRHPQARSAWLAVRAQAAALGQAQASLLPTVSAGVTSTRQTTTTDSVIAGADPTTSTLRADGHSLSLNWTLFDFGTRAALRGEARRNGEAAQWAHEAALQQVALGAAQAWHDASAQAAVRAQTQATEDAARGLLAATEAKVAAGAQIPLDALQARAALAQATLARVRAEGAERAAQLTLARALALPARQALLPADDGRFAPAAADVAEADAELQQIDRQFDAALAAHPAVASARAQVQAAQSRADAVFAEGFPTVSLGLAQFVNGRPSTSLSSARSNERWAAVTVSVPLFEGFERVYRMQAQRAQVLSREADLEAAAGQVAADALRSREQMIVARAAIAAADDLLRASEATHAAALERQRLGSADAVEVLNARRDLGAARSERIQALAGWRIARLRLLGALGQLGLASLR